MVDGNIDRLRAYETSLRKLEKEIREGSLGYFSYNIASSRSDEHRIQAKGVSLAIDKLMDEFPELKR